MFSHIYNTLLDVLFPQKELEKEILSFSEADLSQKLNIREHRYNTITVTSLFSYKDPLIRRMIWMLKYRGDKKVARLLGEVLHSYLLEELSDIELFEGRHPVIIPLPLSKRRERERGFNQMVRIAEVLEQCGGVSVDTHTLVRSKDTPSQTSVKNKEKRRENVKGVFKTTRPADTESVYVLLDDVLTTGSTMSEAEKTLRTNGAEHIMCVTIAH